MAASILGLFDEAEPALAAAGALKGSGLGTPGLMSPIPLEGVEDVLGEKKSVIRRFSFFGAMFGAMSGFLLAAGTAVLYLHPTGGRPIITFPPFLVITYEATILIGILATVLGFLISARLPAVAERKYLPETAVDKFAVFMTCTTEKQVRQAEEILREAGAQEVRQMAEGS